MATSAVLKICPSCKVEITAPPPKLCPLCGSSSAWDIYIDKEVRRNKDEMLKRLMFNAPTTVHEQLEHKLSEIGTISHTNQYLESKKARDQYEKTIIALDVNKKIALLRDALTVLKTVFASDHSQAEVSEILAIASKVGPLTDALQKVMSSGVILRKGISYESN